METQFGEGATCGVGIRNRSLYGASLPFGPVQRQSVAE